MAVQKSKKSRAKRNSRRSANTTFKLPSLTFNKNSNEIHLRHFITKSGFYKNKKVLTIDKKDKK